MQTEKMLKESGVQSSNSELVIEKEIGKMEMLNKIIEILNPLINI
jgi:hypothetical protein